jgi:hypothetical protein
MYYENASGKKIHLDKEIARGGEGSVHTGRLYYLPPIFWHV